MTKKEQILSYVQKKNIKLTDEQQKKLDSIQELTDEELDAVSGGCGISAWWPDDPTCPKCGGKDTWSEFEIGGARGVCRHCTENGGQYWWRL